MKTGIIVRALEGKMGSEQQVVQGEAAVEPVFIAMAQNATERPLLVFLKVVLVAVTTTQVVRMVDSAEGVMADGEVPVVGVVGVEEVLPAIIYFHPQVAGDRSILA